MLTIITFPEGFPTTTLDLSGSLFTDFAVFTGLILGVIVFAFLLYTVLHATASILKDTFTRR